MKNLFSNRYKHIKRYRQIIKVISKHGLGHLLEIFNFKNVLPQRFKKTGYEPLTVASRLRQVFEELGPTFIKLGQLLSIRPDLLPPVFISQLEKLQDQVTPVSFDIIKSIIETELNTDFSFVFKYINPQPLAVASIGQVHQAELLTGEPVVIKILRAGVEQLIETDLEILHDLAHFLQYRTDWGRFYRIVDLVDSFSRTIRDELDYSIEAGNAERLGKLFQNDAAIHIPKVYWEYSSRRILVLEALHGIKITATDELEAHNIDKKALTHRLADAYFKQFIIAGFFHADPHPGNILVDEQNRLMFIDFGMVGRIDQQLQQQLGSLIVNIIDQDIQGITSTIIEICNLPRQTNIQALRQEILYLFDKYSGRPLQQIKLSETLRELMNLSYSYHIKIPRNLVLTIRCLILLEGILERLTPGSNLLDLFKPFGKKILLNRFGPAKVAKILWRHFKELTLTSLSLPRHLQQALQTIETGSLKINLEHQGLEQFISRLNLVGNRLSFSLIIASIIIGSSLLALKTPKSLFGNFPIAEAGYILAVFMGIWLLVSIIKSGRI